MNNISILRIIKNRIGYKKLIIYILLILIFVFYLMFFKILFFDEIYFIIIFIYTIYLIILFVRETLKIKYLFKYGIETEAIITKYYFNDMNIYGKYYSSAKVLNHIFYPGYDIEIKNKNGVYYEYNINDEVYNSISIFKITDETMHIKTGSIVIVLVNPKNKNEAIIKELFIKT
jgi:hypothetical protein